VTGCHLLLELRQVSYHGTRNPLKLGTGCPSPAEKSHVTLRPPAQSGEGARYCARADCTGRPPRP